MKLKKDGKMYQSCATSYYKCFFFLKAEEKRRKQNEDKHRKQLEEEARNKKIINEMFKRVEIIAMGRLTASY